MTKLDDMTSVELDAWKRSGTDAEIKRMREAAEPFLRYLAPG